MCAPPPRHLAKATGGFRALNLLVSPFRVWSKARKHVMIEWETANRRPYWANAAGTSAVDTVWRQQVRSEYAKKTGDEAASVLWDMRRFYECIVFPKL